MFHTEGLHFSSNKASDWLIYWASKFWKWFSFNYVKKTRVIVVCTETETNCLNAGFSLPSFVCKSITCITLNSWNVEILNSDFRRVLKFTIFLTQVPYVSSSLARLWNFQFGSDEYVKKSLVFSNITCYGKVFLVTSWHFILTCSGPEW